MTTSTVDVQWAEADGRIDELERELADANALCERRAEEILQYQDDLIAERTAREIAERKVRILSRELGWEDAQASLDAAMKEKP